MTRWLDPQSINIPASFADLNLPPLIAQTLVRRGITDIESARAFLHPDSIPSTPFPEIEKAVKYIILATRTRQPICVWGDFDVDGQTSTTVLVQTLQAIGANVSYYIPIRGKESHGVHVESLKPIIDNGARGREAKARVRKASNRQSQTPTIQKNLMYWMIFDRWRFDWHEKKQDNSCVLCNFGLCLPR